MKRGKTKIVRHRRLKNDLIVGKVSSMNGCGWAVCGERDALKGEAVRVVAIKQMNYLVSGHALIINVT